MDRIEALNRALFLQINAPEGASSWIVHLAVVLADDLVYLIPVLLLACGCGAMKPGAASRSRRASWPFSASA